MKLENIIIENYRQFDTAELAFDQGITILAGANNSGKTSLINLIRSVFVDEKMTIVYRTFQLKICKNGLIGDILYLLISLKVVKALIQ